MSASDFATAVAKRKPSDIREIYQYLNPEVVKQIEADYGNANNLYQWGPDVANRWKVDQYGQDRNVDGSEMNPLVAQAIGQGPTNRDLTYQTALNRWLAQNEGDWKEGYKNSFRNATYDPKYGLMLDEGSGLSDYNKETGMTPEQMAILASIAVGGIIAAPASAGGAGGMSSLGTSTTLADMAAAGTYGSGAAETAGAIGTGAGGGGGGGGGLGGAAGAETGLGTLPQSGTWLQTAIPGEAAPLAAGAEVGSGITTAGAGLGGSSLSLADLASVPTSPLTQAGQSGASSSVMDILKAAGSATGLTMKDVLSAALGVGTSLYGSKINSDAIDKASGLQADANSQALAEMKRQFDIGQSNLQPWLSSGKTALGQLGALTAPNGELNKPFDMNQFHDDAGYRFRLGEGEQATNRAAAARGGFNSGRTLKELQRWSQGLASDEYSKAFDRFTTTNQNKFNRLAALSGIGQQTASQLNSSGNNYGANVANTLTSGANAQGAAAIAGANSRTSGYTGAAGSVMNMVNNNSQQQLLKQILGIV